MKCLKVLVLAILATTTTMLIDARAQFSCEPIDTLRGSGGFGSAISIVRDVNGDGGDDILVGDPSDSGHALLISGLTGDTIWDFVGEGTGDQLGKAVAAAEDIDGDDVADLLIGAPFNDEAGSESGKVYLYSGATGVLIRSWVGRRIGEQFGRDLSGAGLVDADGVTDVIVGAPANDSLAAGGGAAYVFSGVNGRLIRSFASAIQDDSLGYAVAGMGDLDGDLHSDLAVGIPWNDDTGLNAGTVVVYSGANGDELFSLHGSVASATFGSAITNAGDINANGYPDLLIGAPEYSDSLISWFGKAFVYDGLGGGLIYEVPYIYSPASNFGCSVSGAGDLNSDGYNDIVVGSSIAWFPNDYRGFGQSFCGKTGETILFAQLGGWGGPDGFGYAVAGGGDINGDGHFDYLISSYHGIIMAYSVEGLPDLDEDGFRDVCDPCPADTANDPDRDWVCSIDDNCPRVYNPWGEDSDGDGIGDACECVCSCHADPMCDSAINVQDVVTVIGRAFRGDAGSYDAMCPDDPPYVDGRTDLDCDGATSVVDVVRMVNVAFRGMSAQAEFCHICQ